MRTLTRKQSSWSFWRFVRWGLFLMAMVFVLPVLVWFVANRFDESPTAEASEYASKSPRQVADSDNAWLYLVGIGAAPEEDPLVLGRRRVDVIMARYQQEPLPKPGTAETELFVDPVPSVEADTEIDGVAGLCPSRDTDCVVWAGEHVVMLRRLREANALRLTRWQTALTMPDWQALYPPLLDGPVLDTSVASLHLNLLALELSMPLPSVPAKARLVQSTEPTTLEKLAQTVVFWRRVQAAPQELVSTLVAARQIEEAQRIADGWLSRRLASSGSREEAALDLILGPPQGATEWREAMRHEFQLFERTMRDAAPGPWGALGQCAEGTAEQGCVTTVLMNAAYAPQATLNLVARHRRVMEDLLEVDPTRIEAAHRDAGPALEDTFVQYEDTGRLLGHLAYNFSGRILAQIAIPAFDFGRRLHDQEAIRRMIVLKREARDRQIKPKAMEAFLADQPVALRNPFTGEPFGWDAGTGEFFFAPSAAKYWERETLRIAY